MGLGCEVLGLEFEGLYLGCEVLGTTEQENAFSGSVACLVGGSASPFGGPVLQNIPGHVNFRRKTVLLSHLALESVPLALVRSHMALENVAVALLRRHMPMASAAAALLLHHMAFENATGAASAPSGARKCFSCADSALLGVRK